VHAEPSHWLHEISMFQNCLSPFLALSNTPIKTGVTYFIENNKNPKTSNGAQQKKKKLGPLGECWLTSLLHHFWPRLMVGA